MHQTQPLQLPRIASIARQVVYLMRIVRRIEQLFHRFLRPEEQLLRPLQLARRVQLPHLAQHRHLVHIGDVLRIGLARLIIANVPETLVAHGSDDVVGLIHAIARHKHILAGGRGMGSQKRLPLHVRRRSEAGHRQSRGPQVHQAHQAIRHRAVGELAGPADDERHSGAGIVNPAFGARQSAAMVAPEQYNGRIGQPVVFQLFQRVPHHVIHGGNVVIQTRPVLAHHRRVRIVGRQRRLGGVMHLVGRQPRNVLPIDVLWRTHLAFVTYQVIEHRKERHPLRTIPPMRLVAYLIPGRKGRGEVIVRLRVVGAVIARRPQVFRKAPHLRRRYTLAAHVLRPDSGRIHRRNNRRTTRRANPIRRKSMGIPQSLRGQPINVRRPGIRIAVTAKVRARILTTHPEDVPRFARRRLLRKQWRGG